MQEKLTDVIAGILTEAGVDRPKLQVTMPKTREHGDFSTNAAMLNCKSSGRPPRELAELIRAGVLARLPDDVADVRIEGPGFLNFFLKAANTANVIGEVLRAAGDFGRNCTGGTTKKILLEFVSANPTGPLNVVNARAAAAGDCMARILAFAGIPCGTEFYVNDAGNQVKILGDSVFLRYLELFGRTVEFPDDAYQGDYIRDIAEAIRGEIGDQFLDADREDARRFFSRRAIELMLARQRAALDAYGTKFDCWFSEKKLHESGAVTAALDEFRTKGLAYEKDGAWWFAAEKFGDEKDRVLVRSNGEPTYFLADIAYHLDKFRRGFTHLVDIWGPDHHGYIKRLSAALCAYGYPEDSFRVIIAQQVNLLEGDEKVRFSKRKGKIVEMKNLVEEVGPDACRYFFSMRTLDSHLDFDLALAKTMSSENPVFYVQYAHARASNVFVRAHEAGLLPAAGDDATIRTLLDKTDMSGIGAAELELATILRGFPLAVRSAAESLEPHRLVNYLHDELAAGLQKFYQKPENRVLCDDEKTRKIRLCLIGAVKQVLKTGLHLLGLTAPEKM